MTHPGNEELQEHLDGELPAERSAEIDRHVATCADCRHERDALVALAATAAALPRRIAPAHDLWPGVAERIARPAARRRWPILAAAAALALSAGASVLLLREAPSPEAAAQADAERAVAELRAALAARHLDAETAAAVEQNLRIIDEAIGDIHAALRSAPGDGELERTLAEAYRAKVRLVRQTEYLTRTNERG